MDSGFLFSCHPTATQLLTSTTCQLYNSKSDFITVVTRNKLDYKTELLSRAKSSVTVHEIQQRSQKNPDPRAQLVQAQTRYDIKLHVSVGFDGRIQMDCNLMEPIGMTVKEDSATNAFRKDYTQKEYKGVRYQKKRFFKNKIQWREV